METANSLPLITYSEDERQAVSRLPTFAFLLLPSLISPDARALPNDAQIVRQSALPVATDDDTRRSLHFFDSRRALIECFD